MSEPILSFLADGLTAESAGGKGANLAALSRAGFAVPPGFILSTQAYQEFVLENHIQPRILVLMNDLSTERLEAAERVSQAIYALFAQANIPEQLAQQITAAYRDLAGGGSSAVAVRSSANAEDLPGFAFAGQQDTFLNVVGEQALLAAVKDCWASLWTARAITYRARNGFAPESVALAVVIQAMVAAEVSGVLFSANPLTGKRREIHIDASFGLGEAIVSGQVEPDHYVVDPVANQITERRLGAKQVLIGSKAGGGTERIERGPEGGEAQALPDAAILELAQIGQRVEAHFGEPQDIEWAWAAGCFFLLQSRPITSLFPLPDETLAQAEPQIYFNFNAMQGVPGPLTPLGIAALRMVFSGALTTLGIQRPAEQVFRQAGGRLFLDFGDLPRDPTLQKMVLNFLSSIEPGERDILRQLIEDGRIPPRRVLTPRTALGMLRAFGPILSTTLASLVGYPRALDRVAQEADGFVEQVQASVPVNRAGAIVPASAVDRAGAVDRAATVNQSSTIQLGTLRDDLDACLRAMERYLPSTEQISLRAMPLALIANNLVPLLNGWLTKWLGEPPGAAMPLLRSLPGNVTVAMNLRLWAAAQAVRADARAAEQLRSQPVERLAEQFRLGQLPAAAQQAVGQFLQSDGMRGLAEIDLGNPRWQEDPTSIFGLLKGYLQLDDPNLAPDRVYRQGAAQAEQLILDYSQRIRQTRWGGLRVRLFLWAARRVRALASLREVPLYTMARVYAIFRSALLRIGAGLVVQNRLERADDIFFIPLPILKEWVQSGTVDLKSEAAAQRAVYAREMLRKQTPRVLLSSGEGFIDAAGEISDGGEPLSGTPVAPGAAVGIARVILDPQGAHLEPGEILVCPSTDPGWTPLFLTAAGLVMEIGGLMTHGSVVAREYGIPAVVGVRGATTRIKTGQRIRVDGNQGWVRVEEE